MGAIKPKEIGAATAKMLLLKVLEELPPEGVVITKRGKPVARLLPVASSTSALLGVFRGRVWAEGVDQVESPVPASAWTADVDNVAPAKRRRRA